MAENDESLNNPPTDPNPSVSDEQKQADEAARVAEQAEADQKAADEEAALQAKIKADKEAKKAEAAKAKPAKPAQKPKPSQAQPKATPEVPPLDEAGAAQTTPPAETPPTPPEDDPTAQLPQTQPRRPATKDRAQKFDLKALIDALPDDLYEAFVAGRSLNEQGVDVETGFDIKAINNPLLDSIRINLRNQGYLV